MTPIYAVGAMIRRPDLFTAVAGITGTAIVALFGPAFGETGFIVGGIAAGLLAVFATVHLLARARAHPTAL